jgi:hypothetical protein
MSDVFTTDDNEATVSLKVNGQDKGEVPATGSLRAFLTAQATKYGVKTFTAYGDGEKLTTEDSGSPVSEYTSIEIAAKDSRGC